MPANPFKELEKKIDELVSLCQELNEENRALKTASTTWKRERRELTDKSELARSKVAATLDRLRTME